MNESSENMVTIGRAVELLQPEFPDITVSSLRFLQREGLISPQRKPGGHRLYSPDDIERIRIIKQWQASRIPLKEIRERLDNMIPGSQLPQVVDEITGHLLKGDLDAALDVLEALNSAGTPLLTLCEDVLAPVLLNLGDDQGNHLIPVDLQFELDERLIRFLANATVPPVNPPLKPVVLLACPLWERHDLPLRMLGALLEERGASVHFVGSLVDKAFMIDAMERLKPDVVLVSMTVTPGRKIVSDWFLPVIDAMKPGAQLLVGGMGAVATAHIAADSLTRVGTERYPETVNRVMVLQ